MWVKNEGKRKGQKEQREKETHHVIHFSLIKHNTIYIKTIIYLRALEHDGREVDGVEGLEGGPVTGGQHLHIEFQLAQTCL